MNPAPQPASLTYLQRKVQAYTFLSTLFLVIGGIIFLDLYSDNIRGQVVESLKSLKTIGIFVLPFLPGIVLSMMAAKTQAKYAELVHKSQGGGGAQAARPKAKGKK